MGRIMQILNDEAATARQMEDLILHDQSLSARLLRLANSPLYGFRAEVKSIAHAITLLGLDRVKCLAIGMNIFDTFRRGAKSEGTHITSLWMHSYAVAMLSQEIWNKRAGRRESDFAFLCGLLHDVGKVVYFKKEPMHYSLLFTQERSERDPTLSALEQEYYGISHAVLGAVLAEHWGFPASLCAVIRNHHSAADPSVPLAAAVCIADNIARVSGVGHSGERRPNQHMHNLQQLIRMGDQEYQRSKSYAESRRKEIEDFFQSAWVLPTAAAPRSHH
jgi:putative nucleotidyltransferase with HDIG domain